MIRKQPYCKAVPSMSPKLKGLGLYCGNSTTR